MRLELPWTQARQITRGRLRGGSTASPIQSLSIDTRSLKKGEVFLALKGPRHDGHDFLLEAIEKGASGLILDRHKGARIPKAPSHLGILEVPEPLKALQELALHHRKRFFIPILGITGSNGKTTTKELLRQLLESQGPVCATPENFNNSIGVPLSLLELSPAHCYGVFEMGASRKGDILELGRLVCPTGGILTNIAKAHIEFFGSLQKVLETKLELIETLPPQAPVILNGDDPHLKEITNQLGPRAITFGKNLQARMRLQTSAEGGRLYWQGRLWLAHLPWPETALQMNLAAACAAALTIGLDPEGLRSKLAALTLPPLRFEVRSHSSGALFLIDAYNANPGSMRAGLEGFCERFAQQEKFAILGDMLELGSESRGEHYELGRFLTTLPLAGVFLIGPEMAYAYEGARSLIAPIGRLEHLRGLEEAEAPLKALLQNGRAFLFKASRAIGLERLLQKL
ncbi:MAG: UDP-N-acetylmuramoyl-tripeptide--D-alanyl-D-alanine ligase [Elusimicrobia bacterium]|nr:UDP-N-acetylmuramoyl-tripeptide--D-alanyl-D-alanine ligase [Elusimicrobiota bacterium]